MTTNQETLQETLQETQDRGIGKTHRQAMFGIVNNTGKTLLSVDVSHKYSDNYKNSGHWEYVQDGESTSTAIADYNTGWLTTGRDWWVVTWVDDEGNTFITDPQNFRDFADLFEKIADKAAVPLAKLAAETAIKSPESRIKAIAAASAITLLIAGQMLNTEGTAGYKQHILRDEDRSRPTRIIIRPNGVEFDSRSGKSTTGFRRFP